MPAEDTGPHKVGRRFCAVQAFWPEAKPWRRRNSFPPSIVITGGWSRPQSGGTQKERHALRRVFLFGTSQHYRCHSLRPFASVRYIIFLIPGRQFSAMSLQSFDAVILYQDFHLADGDGVGICQPLGLTPKRIEFDTVKRRVV